MDEQEIKEVIKNELNKANHVINELEVDLQVERAKARYFEEQWLQELRKRMELSQ